MTIKGFGGSSGGGGSGTVTNIATGTGLTGGPITGTGTISVANNTANTLAGFDNGGIFSDVVIGTGLSLSGGTISVNAITGVSSVSNIDGTITISPTTGAVVASLALGHANTWTGQQTFNTSAPIFGTMTAGSVLFAGVSGLLSQDNANLFWDNTNKRLGIGTGATVSARLHSLSTTEQLRIGYDVSDYASLTTGSTGSLAVTVTGTNPNITFTAGGTGINTFNSGQSGTAVPANVFNNTSTNQTPGVASFLAPNMPTGAAGQGAFFSIGVANSLQNAGAIQFVYIGAASTSNYLNFGIYGASGPFSIFASNIGIGITSVPSAKLQILSTTEQLRLNYDASNFLQTAVGSTGNVQVITNGSANSYSISTNNFSLTGSSTGWIFNRSSTSAAGITIASVNMTSSAAGGIITMLNLNPTLNQSSTAGYTCLLVNPTENSIGSGSKLLADFQVGGASKLSITNTGSINSSMVQTTLSGTTAGSVVWSQPLQGTSFKKFVGFASGYENNSAVNQTITFTTAFTNTPSITVNSTGLTITVSVSTLTITAPNNTTLFTGNIIVEGY